MNLKQIFIAVGAMAISQTGFAKGEDRAYFENASVQIEIFKDVGSFELAVDKDMPDFRQLATVKVNGVYVDAFRVSTGNDGQAGFRDGSIETPAGYFSIDEVAETFVYLNRDGSTFTQPWALYFFDIVEVLPEELAEQLRNQPHNRVAMHTYAAAGITGRRASHGCVRSPQAKMRALWDRVNGLRNKNEAAIAVYGRTMDGDGFVVRPEAVSREEIRLVRDLLEN